jgi:hypothetical protein
VDGERVEFDEGIRIEKASDSFARREFAALVLTVVRGVTRGRRRLSTFRFELV